VTDLLSEYYPWVKAVHVMGVIAWMAGLFYLPRLFVYHAEKGGDAPVLAATLTIMERRLLRAIMNPAMIVTWICGLMLVATPGIVDWSVVWPWTKAASVVAMTIFHMWLAQCRKRLEVGTDTLTGRQYRMMNEVPTVLMIIIVLSVIVKF
jgi:protoporphyrinogen IX oxidase